MKWRTACLEALLVLTGRADLEPPGPRAANQADAACPRWFETPDEAVDRAGAMRQWGRHATAFMGRRHFGDADLIDARFAVAALDAA